MADGNNTPFTFEQVIWLLILGLVGGLSAYLMALHPDTQLLAISASKKLIGLLGLA